jgi:oligosaccharide repeat unit polymerase
VSEHEIASAGLLADIALIGITAGLILSSNRDRRNTTHSSLTSPEALLSVRIVRYVSIVAFPVGIVSLLVGGAVPKANTVTVDFGEWGTSSWLMVTQFWSVLVLLALIYLYGFRRLLTLSIGVFLVLMSIQGFDRFRVVLPAIFLLITWQTRTGRKWPRKWMVVSLACLAMLIFPMKKLGRMVRSGESLSDVSYVFSDSLSETIKVRSQDQMFLDQLASTVWLADESGHYSYGSMYYPLLFLPVPRQLWPDKPSLSWYWAEISSPSRPMYENGMSATLVGEAYLNLGLIGVIAVPFGFGYWIGRFYFLAMHKSYFSVYRFIYVTLASCMIQVFRDGLGSLVVIPAVDLMPLVAIAGLSFVAAHSHRRWVAPGSSLINGQQRRAI